MNKKLSIVIDEFLIDLINAAIFYQRCGLDKWHGYSTDKSTVKIIKKLQSLGYIETNKFDQARLIKEFIKIERKLQFK